MRRREGYRDSTRRWGDLDCAGSSRFCCWLVALLRRTGRCRAPSLRIDVLSNRADLISAGDALVAVELPAGVEPGARSRVTAGGRDVTERVRACAPNGRFEGLVDGLALGAQRAHRDGAQARSGARVTIIDHPNGGPVFSGPQVQPWECQASATDAQCNQPPTLRLPVQVLDVTGQFARLRPGEPAVRRRDDDDRPGQDGAVHRPHRDRLPGPRPVQDRRPLRPGQAVDGRGRRSRSGTTSC